MKLKLMMGILVLSTALSACGDREPGSSSKTGGSEGRVSPTRNKTGEEYFAQFEFKATGDCKNPEAIRFKYLFSDTVSQGSTSEGHKIVAVVGVYLKTDIKQFAATYSEMEITSQDDEPLEVKILYNQYFQDSYTIENAKLVLKGLGEGEKFITDKEEAVKFTYARNLRSIGGRVTTLHYIESEATSLANLEDGPRICAREIILKNK